VAADFEPGVDAAKDFAARFEEAHFRKEFGFGEVEGVADPGGLQGEKDEVTAGERGAEAVGDPDAEGAVGVEEDPTLDVFDSL
jgi:hypothetical protein